MKLLPIQCDVRLYTDPDGALWLEVEITAGVWLRYRSEYIEEVK